MDSVIKMSAIDSQVKSSHLRARGANIAPTAGLYINKLKYTFFLLIIK